MSLEIYVDSKYAELRLLDNLPHVSKAKLPERYDVSARRLLNCFSGEATMVNLARRPIVGPRGPYLILSASVSRCPGQRLANQQLDRELNTARHVRILLLTLFFFFGMLICHLNAQDGPGTITTIAGTGTAGFSGDDGLATSARLFNTKGLAVDGAGNLFIAEYGNNRVRKVTSDGIIRTVAGNGTLGFSGDGGPATSAQLNYPAGIAVDASGNLFIADGSNHRIRKVAPDGTITTVAGNGNIGNGNPFFGGDGGPATSAQLFVPQDVVADAAGNLFIADFGNSRIRKVTPAGIISTVAGGGTSLTDGSLATSAQLNSPSGVALDVTGNLFISGGGHIRKVTPAGIITTVAGTGALGAVDADGNLFIAGDNRIQKVTPGGVITTVAGNGTVGFGGDGGPAVCAQLWAPVDVVVDSGGNLFIADYGNYRIRKVVSGSSGAIPVITGITSTWGAQGTTLSADIQGTNLCGATAVTFSGTGVTAALSSGGLPTSLPITITIALAAATGVRTVRVTTPAGTSDPFTGFTVGTSGLITTVAGNGTSGFGGDGGLATSARLAGPFDVAVNEGSLFIADTQNNRIRKVASDGNITTVAGNGTSGFSGDGGPATSARLAGPSGVAVDGSGNLFIADFGNSRIRKVTPAGIISTVAGGGTGFGDGGPATSATLSSPYGVAVDGSGNLFIVDLSNYRIRRVTPGGIITTVAGNGSSFFSGDGGLATSAGLKPFGVAVDTTGNLFIADFDNYRIRKVTPNGVITTIAGNGTPGYSGDGGPATSAQLGYSRGVAVDATGNLFIVGSSSVRKVTADGTITTVAGHAGLDFSGDCVRATSAGIHDPPRVAVDGSGNLYIADTGNNRIRKVSANATAPTITGITPASGTQGATISANIAGSNLSCPIAVSFSGTGVTATISAGASETSLPITISIASEAVTGTRVFTVTTPNGTSDPFSGFPVFVGTPFTISNFGGLSLTTEGRSETTVSGYARIQPNSGSTTPAGLAIFGFRQNNVLVSETSVPASLPLTSGRIYAEINASVGTGIAIANPNDSAATINFFFTDSTGVDLGSGSTTITANGQLARFLDQAPFNRPAPFQGTFSFTSNVPVGVIALRGLTNERSEFLMSTLPVIDTTAAQNSGTQVIPEYADGGGWTTQILLVNPTSALMPGTLQFLNQDGIAANVTVAGQADTTVAYSIPARSSRKLSTAGAGATTAIGSVRVIPAEGSASPTPLAIFSYRSAGITVSEAGVPVTTARALRMYVESLGESGQPGNVQSGIAVANASSSLATVTFELTQLDGSPVAGVRPGFIILAGSGQTSKFLAELFPTLPNPFKGVLRIATTSSAVSVADLRTRYNERGDFLITTTPPIVESSPAASTEMEFPHLADGGGFTTQLILFSGRAGQASSGTVRLYDSNGRSLDLTLR